MLGIDGKRVDWKNMPLAQMVDGNSKDAYFTLKCFNVLWPRICANGMQNTYDAILKPATLIFAEMEYGGMLIDPENLEAQGKVIAADTKVSREKLLSYPESHKDANFNSSDQVNQILFNVNKEGEEVKGGFGLYPPILTDKKAPSTAVEALELILDQIEEELNRRGEVNG